MKEEIQWLKTHYEVTANGRIFRIRDNRELIAGYDKKGYLRIRLQSAFSRHPDGGKTYKVHRLVAMYYLPDYDDNLQVNHKNGIKSDNRIENLEMATSSQNALHAWRTLNKSERLRKLNAHRNPITGRFERIIA